MKQSVKALIREYGLPEHYTKAHLRYKSPPEKGVCWYWFSQFIRSRDSNRWGTCISCGKPKTLEELQAGHFVSSQRGGTELLMDTINVNGECGGCNAFDPMHLFSYAKNLDKRYGEGTAQNLLDRLAEKNIVGRLHPKEPSPVDYLIRAQKYRALVENGLTAYNSPYEKIVEPLLAKKNSLSTPASG